VTSDGQAPSAPMTIEITEAIIRHQGHPVVQLIQRPGLDWEVRPCDLDFPFSSQTVGTYIEAQQLGGEMASDIVRYRRALDGLRDDMRGKYGANHAQRNAPSRSDGAP
jgi:hypothetical protein